MRTTRWVTTLSLLVATCLFCPARPAAGQIAPPAGACHEEGKDPFCGHYKATIARLLARDADPAGEADEDTDVTHCLLDVELDPVAETISGSNTVSATSLVGGLTTFTLDLRDNMAVDGVTMGGSPVGYVRVDHTIEITLDQAYDTGQSFEVAITYHGSPEEDLGFSSFDWSTHGEDDTPIVATLSEPWYAHTWWPCKDSLGDKFTIDIWVTVPDWMVVASNGLLQGTDAVPGDKLRYRWYESYPIITYLVSLAGTNYTQWTEYYNHAGGAMPVEFYAYPEDLSSMQSDWSDVVTQIETFSQPDVYGEYPFINEKYGIAQFEGGAAGMEHQTITSQRYGAWWLNAHELAHQWWGDMITCGTWHDIWLNEGFATFSEALYREKKPGGSHAAYLSRMMYRRPSDFGGSVYVYDAASLGSVFSSNNVYKKGAWAVHMLRHVVGDEDFFDILAAYRAAYEGGSAITEDLRIVAEGVYGSDLTWYFDEWIYGVGAPYYRYGWQDEQIGGEHQVRLHVEQYQQELPPPDDGYPLFRMPIDITVTTGSGSETHVIWQEEDIEWYVLPADGAVIDVEFDKDTWILRGDASNVPYQPPLQVVEATPQPGSSGTPAMNVTQVEIQFSEPITYDDSDFAVTGSVSGPRTPTVTYDGGENEITLSFATLLTAGEVWTVQVADDVRWQENDSQLDGELADPADPASLPSGDGLPGGDAIFSFFVTFTGDFDADGDVDMEDFGPLQACLTLPQTPPAEGCERADLDHDDDVDKYDLDTFLSCLSGPNVAPGPGCG